MKKDLLEKPPKIKLLLTPKELFMMLKDWSEENTLIKLSKVIKNTCLMKSLIKMENHIFPLLIKDKLKIMLLKKSLPWSSSKWKKLLKLTSALKLLTLSLQFLLISMMLKDKLPKMPEPLLDLTLLESSTNLLPLLLLMDLIKNLEKKISSSSILEVVLSMFPFLLLITESLKSFLPQEILILEEKILIKEPWNISWNLSKRKIMLIFLKIKELSKNSKEKLKEPREPYHLPMKLKSKLKLYMTEMISLKSWLELDSKN